MCNYVQYVAAIRDTIFAHMNLKGIIPPMKCSQLTPQDGQVADTPIYLGQLRFYSISFLSPLSPKPC